MHNMVIFQILTCQFYSWKLLRKNYLLKQNSRNLAIEEKKSIVTYECCNCVILNIVVYVRTIRMTSMHV